MTEREAQVVDESSVTVFCPQKFLSEGSRDEDGLARLLPRLSARGQRGQRGQRQVREGEAKGVEIASRLRGQSVNTARGNVSYDKEKPKSRIWADMGQTQWEEKKGIFEYFSKVMVKTTS